MATQTDKLMSLLQRLYREDPDVTVEAVNGQLTIDTDVDLGSDNRLFEGNGWARTQHARNRTQWTRTIDGRWKEAPGEETRPRR